MIIIGASEVDIADLHVFTAEEAEGNQMDFIRAARPERTGRHTVQIFAAGVLHPDYAAARYAYIAYLVAVYERHIVAGSGVRPVHAGNTDVVPVHNVIGIVSRAGGLPDNRSRFNAKLDVVLKPDVCCHITSSIEGIVSRYHDHAAALGADVVDRLLDSRRIVGEAVTACTEIQHRHSVIRQGKGIWIPTVVAVAVPDPEPLANTHRFTVLPRNTQQEQRGKAGHAGILIRYSQRKGGAVRHAGGQFILLTQIQPIVFRFCFVQRDFSAGVCAVQRAAHRDGFAVGGTGGQLADIAGQGSLTFKGHCLDLYAARCGADGFQPEPVQVTGQVAAGGQIEVVGCVAGTGLDVQDNGFVCGIRGVIRRSIGQTDARSIGAVAHADENGVAQGQQCAVRRPLFDGDGRRGQGAVVTGQCVNQPPVFPRHAAVPGGEIRNRFL